MEYAIEFIQTVGPVFSRKHKELQLQQTIMQWRKPEIKEETSYDKAYNHITVIKNRVSVRMRYLIMNMEELRRSNWVPRVKAAEISKKVPIDNNKTIHSSGGGAYGGTSYAGRPDDYRYVVKKIIFYIFIK